MGRRLTVEDIASILGSKGAVFRRGAGNKRKLLVPVSFCCLNPNKDSKLEVVGIENPSQNA